MASMQPTQAPPMRPSFSLIWQAAKSGNLTRVTSLLESESPHSGEELSPFLGAAADGGHIAVARYLLELGASIGTAPLRAVKAKSTAMLQLFIEYGWHVNDPVWCGHVVLPYAIEDQSLLLWLLDRGADPNLGRPLTGVREAPESNSGDCLNQAASRSSITAFDLLLVRGAKLENSRPLHAAIESMNEDKERIPMMAHLLDLGVDINGTDYVRRLATPLHHAVLARKIERASFLVKRGADPHIKNQYGTSALEMARINERMEFVELFSQGDESRRGANPATTC